MGRARARKQDTDLSDRRAGQGFRVPGRDAVLTIIGLQDAGTLPECGAPAREQVTGLAGAGAAGIGSGILIGDQQVRLRGPGGCAGIRGAEGRVMAWPAAGYGALAAGGLRGEEDEQA
jgi:hypothetical protein